MASVNNSGFERIWQVLKPWLFPLFIGSIFFAFATPIRATLYKIILYARPGDDTYAAPVKEEAFDFSFSIKDLQGNKIPFEAFRGKVLFVNLWATWCPPCRAEMPGIEALYNRVKDSNIQFVLLSVDDDSDRGKVRRYIEKNQFTFPVYMSYGNLPQQLRVPSIPTTFIVDKQGNVVRKKEGMTNFNTGAYVKLLEDLARQEENTIR
ncbi:MAG: hypothetical protein KatS3mg032_0410 [Cyclobacteriaceae bacterium]|nr:MAG: hypothetical protein KatS3mg032_0410 [Cyclobacteriaceae bacterium]